MCPRVSTDDIQIDAFRNLSSAFRHLVRYLSSAFRHLASSREMPDGGGQMTNGEKHQSVCAFEQSCQGPQRLLTVSLRSVWCYLGDEILVGVDLYFFRIIMSFSWTLEYRWMFSISITKTCLFKYTENLPPKNENFQIKKHRVWVLVRTASTR